MENTKQYKDFKKWLNSNLESTCEGIVGEVYHKGEKNLEINVGKTYQYYDIASLTKIIFTTSAFIQLVDNKNMQLDEPIGKWLDWYQNKETPVLSFLNHSSGLPGWKPFYLDLTKEISKDKRSLLLKNLISKEKLEFSERSRYSDIGFMTLGFLLENLWDCSLEEIWKKLNLKMDDTHFHIGNKPVLPRECYAPTEECIWRSKIIQGEVHDDNAWSLDGVAPHSGLFSNADNISRWFLEIRKGLLGKDSKTGSSSTIKMFSTRTIPVTQGDWATGFMLPTKGRASCGKYFSPDSIGHTGFTGSSAWFDPQKDLLIVLLSNRTYPDRNNNRFGKLRPLIHDRIVELLNLEN